MRHTRVQSSCIELSTATPRRMVGGAEETGGICPISRNSTLLKKGAWWLS
jgi:hypothetical protein